MEVPDDLKKIRFLDSSFSFVKGDGTEVPARRYINPDGSVGGWVASTAVVDATATIRPYGRVWPEAVVGPNEIVSDNRFGSSAGPKLAL